MIPLVDTHLHLDLLIQGSASQDVPIKESDYITTLIQDAAQQGVNSCITIGTHRHDSACGVMYATQYMPIFASIGIHPTECTEHWKQDLIFLQTLLNTTRSGIIVAIGECGIDLYRSSANKLQQQDLFCAQIELALTYNLPVIIHSRNAPEETFACLDRYANETLRGSLHCFSYDMSYAQEAYTRGFVLGIGGTLTYPKNQVLRDVVIQMPLESLVLETDAPFLPPQPWRGKQNHPKYIAYIAEQIALLKLLEYEAVAAITTATAHRIFTLRKEL